MDLEGKEKKDGGLISVKECPLCHMVMQAPADACPYCGYIFEKEERKENGMKSDVALEEIKEKPYEEYKQCQTFDELVTFQKAKNTNSHGPSIRPLSLGLRSLKIQIHDDPYEEEEGVKEERRQYFANKIFKYEEVRKRASALPKGSLERARLESEYQRLVDEVREELDAEPRDI